jgi:hypothetical protein
MQISANLQAIPRLSYHVTLSAAKGLAYWKGEILRYAQNDMAKLPPQGEGKKMNQLYMVF